MRTAILLLCSVGSVVLPLACASDRPPPVAPPSAAAVTAPAAAPVAMAPAASLPRPPWASAYPETRTVDAKDTLFGTEVRDPYRWLEDGKSPEVQAWMRSEDDLTRAKLAAVPAREALAARLRELLYVEGQHPPSYFAGRYFFEHREAKQEKYVLYWRATKTAKARVLLDPNAWSADGSTSLAGWSPSWDGAKVAYTVSKNNSDEATMHVIDVASGKESRADVIEGCKYAAASWTPRGEGFYYTRVPVDPKIPIDELPGYAEIRFHKLGADPASDPVVREKTGDPRTFLNGSISKDGRWLLAMVWHGDARSDVLFRDLRAAKPEWLPLTSGKDALYDVSAHRGRFYVRTNEGAPRWRVFSVDPAHAERAAWKEIVPERSDATLDGWSTVGNALSLAYLKDATSRVELRDLDGKLIREVTLPGVGSASVVLGDEDDDDGYFTYESFTAPRDVYEISIKSGQSSVWFHPKIPVDPSPYEVEQLFFASKDGTRVPMFVVHARSMKKDGSTPLILEGYGGFNVSMTPVFEKTLFPWLEHGGAYAMVNLRGGGEYGEAWHRAGMRHEKQHVFDDVAAAAEHLQKSGYTSADRTVVRGASNGGLLVGAAITQRPELFRAAICGVPLIDMIRYHLFGAGRTWIEEYGSAEDEQDFRALYAYSPLQHVAPGTRYPSVLLESADSDDRVDPMHGRKFAAALQAASTGGPVLLRIERNSGHGGADLVRSFVDAYADEYAFLLAEVAKSGSAIVH